MIRVHGVLTRLDDTIRVTFPARGNGAVGNTNAAAPGLIQIATLIRIQAMSKRSHLISARFDDMEFAQIERAHMRKGISISDFVRQASLLAAQWALKDDDSKQA